MLDGLSVLGGIEGFIVILLIKQFYIQVLCQDWICLLL